MKICAVIAEYNPFHLGHLKHIEYVKNNLNAEKVIVIMSGNFTQRGEMAILDKFTRAKHAVLAGADLVIELPTVFATANAEVFAKGAVNIINSLGVVDGICFGVESGDKESYINLANAMNDESKEFKKAVKSFLDDGVSLAKAKFEALSSLNDEKYDKALISSPNNILGLEYTKALLKLNSNIEIYPMIRTGDHNDQTLKKGITSASSIRNALYLGQKRKVKPCVPKFVYGDLETQPLYFDKLAIANIMTANAKEMAKILDCTEGLENRIIALAKDNHSLDVLVDKISTKRYTKTRIRRIILSNLLKIDKYLIQDCLENKLYAKILAVNEKEKGLISLLTKNSSIPILTRKSDTVELKKIAKTCFATDVLANDIYALCSGKKQNENQTLFI